MATAADKPDLDDIAYNVSSMTLGYSGNTLSGTLTVGDGVHTATLALLGQGNVAANFTMGLTDMAVRWSAIRRSPAHRAALRDALRRGIERLVSPGAPATDRLRMGVGGREWESNPLRTG